jgi:hypothetical protein
MEKHELSKIDFEIIEDALRLCCNPAPTRSRPTRLSICGIYFGMQFGAIIGP